MNALLRKIKLIDDMTITLPISKVEFVRRLHDITDAGGVGGVFDVFDVYFSSKKEYKGTVNLNNFVLTRKKRFFDPGVSLAVANGTFTENNGQVTIETAVNGFHPIFIALYVFFGIFYSIAIVVLIIGINQEGFVPIPFISGLLLQCTFMGGMPYFIMRKSVTRFKYELEREFYYLTK